MERDNEFNSKVREALLSDDPLFEAPPLSAMREARDLVAQRQTVTEKRPEILGVLSRLMNLHVKLYHVILACLVLWFCFMLSQNKPEEKHEVSATTYSYGLASTSNNTVLCSIGTCIKK